jgi:dihydroorotate dehydrogenase
MIFSNRDNKEVYIQNCFQKWYPMPGCQGIRMTDITLPVRLAMFSGSVMRFLMKASWPLLRPLLFLLPAETAHNLTLALLRSSKVLLQWMGASKIRTQYPALQTNIGGIPLDHPLGLAAGLDKSGRSAPALAQLGFSFLELGTITAHPQPGNPKPRLFRIPEIQAIVNRMGFNNAGAEAAAQILQSQGPLPVPRGLNIGKSKLTPLDIEAVTADYASSTEYLSPHSDYLCINVSSPNTPGLRSLQEVDSLEKIFQSVASRCSLPLAVKLAPDLADEDILEITKLAKKWHSQNRLWALILHNTTIKRPDFPEVKKNSPYRESGGLSGKPLGRRSVDLLKLVYGEVGGSIPLISVGGIFTGEDAWQRIIHGASLLQVYTGLIYRGPGIIDDILATLDKKLSEHGLNSIEEAVGLHM